MTIKERAKDKGTPKQIISTCNCSEGLRPIKDWWYCPNCFEPAELDETNTI